MDGETLFVVREKHCLPMMCRSVENMIYMLLIAKT